MLNEGNSLTTVGMHLRSLRAVINKAITDGELGKNLYPFGRRKYSPPKGAGNKRWPDDDKLRQLYNYDGEFTRAKDFWLFSYFANGINIKDICLLK
jgi:integrase/recombinase XerD